MNTLDLRYLDDRRAALLAEAARERRLRSIAAPEARRPAPARRRPDRPKAG